MDWYEMIRKMDDNQESLGGDWDFCVWEGETPPQEVLSGLAWQPGAYPLEDPSGPGRQTRVGFHMAFLVRRGLRLQARAGLRAWLCFERCGGAALFYLNGRRFYASQERWLPVELDIQDHASPGENELVIWREAGDGPLLGARLVYLPAVSLPDLVVRPRRGMLDLEVTIENRTLERFEGRLELRLRGPALGRQPSVGSGTGLLLDSQEAVLERGLLTNLALRTGWEGDRVWSLREPWLYELEARLSGKGGLLDARRVHFGLRELRRQGSAWQLNGLPLKTVRASLEEVPDFAAALAALHSLKAAGTTVLSLHSPYPGYILYAADQVGMLVESHSSDWGLGGLPPDPAFQDARQDHLRRLARRDRSHPSLAAWYLDGEVRDSGKLVEVLRGMDPTRPIVMG